MKTTERKIVYDEILKIEAFHLEGIFQPFPNHFHEYYVIGLIEKGKRKRVSGSRGRYPCVSPGG